MDTLTLSDLYDDQAVFTITVENDVPAGIVDANGDPVVVINATVQEDALGNEAADPAADDVDLVTGNLDDPGVDTDTASGGNNTDGDLSRLVADGADSPATFGVIEDTGTALADALPALFSNGERLTYSASGNTVTASTSAGTIFTLVVNPDGSWSFNLDGPLDHAVAGDDATALQSLDADGNPAVIDSIDFSGVVTVSDTDVDTLTLSDLYDDQGVFTIRIENDVPLAVDDTATAEQIPADYNVTIVLDLSGSMREDPDGAGGFDSRVELATAALESLLTSLDAQSSSVTVNLITFNTPGGTSGTPSAPIEFLGETAAGAITQINTFDASDAQGATPYDAAIQTATDVVNSDAVPDATGDPTQVNLVYFVSDGRPNPPRDSSGSGAALSDAEQQAWEEALTAKEAQSFAIGIGSDIVSDFDTAVDELNTIAFPNNTVAAGEAEANTRIVENESDLEATLLDTIPLIASGNVLDNDSVGADRAVFGDDEAVTAVSSNQTGESADITTADGQAIIQGEFGSLTINADGTFVYRASQGDAGETDVFTYTITDGDGDTDTAILTISLDDVPTVTVDVVDSLALDETVGPRPGDANAEDEQDGTGSTVADPFGTGRPLVGLSRGVIDTGTGTTTGTVILTAAVLFGADGAAAADSLVFDLSLGSNADNTGLQALVGGVATDVTLQLTAEGDVEGVAGSEVAFRIGVDDAGEVTVAQYLEMVHDDTADSDEPGTSAARLADDALIVSVTATDGNGDQAVATADLGGLILFEDDAPSAADDVAPAVATGDTITGNVLDNDDLGVDSGQQLVSFTYTDPSGNQVTSTDFGVPVTTLLGELTVQTDGSYSFTASDTGLRSLEDNTGVFTPDFVGDGVDFTGSPEPGDGFDGAASLTVGGITISGFEVDATGTPNSVTDGALDGSDHFLNFAQRLFTGAPQTDYGIGITDFSGSGSFNDGNDGDNAFTNEGVLLEFDEPAEAVRVGVGDLGDPDRPIEIAAVTSDGRVFTAYVSGDNDALELFVIGAENTSLEGDVEIPHLETGALDDRGGQTPQANQGDTIPDGGSTTISTRYQELIDENGNALSDAIASGALIESVTVYSPGTNNGVDIDTDGDGIGDEAATGSPASILVNSVSVLVPATSATDSFSYTVEDGDGDRSTAEVVLTVFDENFFDTGTATDDGEYLEGDDAVNVLTGGGGDDRIDGLGGADNLSGGEGDDILVGGLGEDVLSGNIGNDVLFGGGDDDLILGGTGNDVLIGGEGADTLTGGAGQDVFVIDNFDDADGSDIADLITDFDAANDILDLSEFFSNGEDAAANTSLVLDGSGNATGVQIGSDVVATFQNPVDVSGGVQVAVTDDTGNTTTVTLS